MQPREIDNRKVEWPSRSCRGEGNRLRVEVGCAQDAPGVRKRARSEGLMRNRRGPTRRPTSGEGGGYKPKAKCHRAGRESEGLVVPRMAATITLPEGRGPALVVSAVEGKGEGMPVRANNPAIKARKPQSRLFIAAERQLDVLGPWFPMHRPAGLTIPRGPWSVRRRERARDMRRPSVSRVPEIGTHGLKGGIRNPGSQEHRA